MPSKTDTLPAELVQARERANSLVLEAESAEREARRARRRARSAQERYVTLLRKHQGEEPLPLPFHREGN